MPDHLNTTQLEAIQRLISEPLRLAVRAEMQAGHERLAGAIERLAEQLAGHVADALRLDRARDQRMGGLEHRVGSLERFRAKVLLVYAAMAVLLSFASALARDWLLARWGGR